MDNKLITNKIVVKEKKILFIPNKGIHYGISSMNAYNLLEAIIIALGVIVE